MWPILIEFHSASSEIRGRIKKKKDDEEEEKESVEKYESAEMYVGQPNNDE